MRRLQIHLGLAALVLAASAPPLWADFQQTNLISDGFVPALLTDSHLKNPWGMSFSAAGPFWVSNQKDDTSTVYTVNQQGAVSINSIVVTVPQAGAPMGPTGQVQNPTTNFVLNNGSPASFIFASLDGRITAWNGGLGTMGTAEVKITTAGGSYTGLAIANPAGGPMLYAANANGGGKIDVFNGTFGSVNLGPNAFKDPSIPAGYVPFNIQNLGNGTLAVTYAPASHGAQVVATEGMGAVGIFDTNGNLLQHIDAGGKMAAPWGVALAPAGFGQFGGDLLVGNFSYIASEINAFDPVTGAYVGTLTDSSGAVIADPGLWQIMFGNGGSGGLADTLYIAAGLNSEQDGLFAAIAPVPEAGSMMLLLIGGCLLYGYRRWRA
jgi:uncharacterized protein (TIGR03118 family)